MTYAKENPILVDCIRSIDELHARRIRSNETGLADADRSMARVRRPASKTDRSLPSTNQNPTSNGSKLSAVFLDEAVDSGIQHYSSGRERCEATKESNDHARATTMDS